MNELVTNILFRKEQILFRHAWLPMVVFAKVCDLIAPKPTVTSACNESIRDIAPPFLTVHLSFLGVTMPTGGFHSLM